MHRGRCIGLHAPMVELALRPVMVLLKIQPFRGHALAAERVAAALEDFDHLQGVVALARLDA